MDAIAKKTIETIEAFKGEFTQSWTSLGFYAGYRTYTLGDLVLKYSDCVRVVYKNKNIAFYRGNTPEYRAIYKALRESYDGVVHLAKNEFLNKKV